MREHVHKRLIDEQVKMILERFIRKELQSEQAMGLLGLKRGQFFEWVKKYRESKETFTIQYHREGKAREMHPEVKGKILQENEGVLKQVIATQSPVYPRSLPTDTPLGQKLF